MNYRRSKINIEVEIDSTMFENNCDKFEIHRLKSLFESLAESTWGNCLTLMQLSVVILRLWSCCSVHGADPSVKNDLGQDAAAMCKSFPELKGMLEKRERKMKLRGTGKKNQSRRSSWKENQHGNTDSARDVVDFVGESVDVVRKSHGRVMEVHQKLKDKFLTPFLDAEIIFGTQSRSE